MRAAQMIGADEQRAFGIGMSGFSTILEREKMRLERKRMQRRSCVALGLSASFLTADIAVAQSMQSASISPAADGTQTVVTQQDQVFEVSGGSSSADGSNLFHSFQYFQLNSDEQLTFITESAVQNVVARINPTHPTLINGQIEIVGSQSNLLLVNPAGILFGADAVINLPAGLTATTADAIEFEGEWLSASGTADYSALSGEIGAFAFTSSVSAALVNEGSLTAALNQSITLIGGEVVNTGTLLAPGGYITLAAVPGDSLVRLSSPGQLLSLDIDPTLSIDLGLSGDNSYTPLSLPHLLTRYESSHATQLSVDNDDGTIRLTGSAWLTPAQKETAMVSGLVDVSTESLIADLGTDPAQAGGTISILGEQVALLDAQVEASGAEGGAIWIGENPQVQGESFRATHTFVDEKSQIFADSEIEGGGGDITIGAEDTLQLLGTISAVGGVEEGASGSIEISGGNQGLSFVSTGDAAGDISGEILEDTNAYSDDIESLLSDPFDIRIVDGEVGSRDSQSTGATTLFEESDLNLLTLSEETLESLSGGADVTLQTTNDIVVEDLEDDELRFMQGTGTVLWLADADQDGTGNIEMEDTVDTLSASGRSIQISGADVTLGNLSSANADASGRLTVSATGALNARNLDAHAQSGTGGNVVLSAEGSILTADINTEGRALSGDVTITSETSSIRVGSFSTGGESEISGAVNLSAPDGFTVGSVAVDSFGHTTDSSNSNTNDSSPNNNSAGNSNTGVGDFGGRVNNASKPSKSGRRRQQSGDRGRSNGSHRKTDAQAPVRTALSDEEASASLTKVESQRNQALASYLGREVISNDFTSSQVQQHLAQINNEMEQRSIIVSVHAPQDSAAEESGRVVGRGDAANNSNSSYEPYLTLLIFAATGDPIKITIPDVSAAQLFQTINEFRNALFTSVRRDSTSYLSASQQLYQWLIEPIEAELGPDAISTILFSMDSGLRSLPVAALHDGERFVVEKYSVGMVPSLSSMRLEYRPLEENPDVLAMGASYFSQQAPLPAVPIELATIGALWPTQQFLNEAFTLSNLQAQQQRSPADIIHLATHAEFNPGSAKDSYIQMWNEQLSLDDIYALGWSNTAVDLLVLSACQTAIGNSEAEMGFAGLAVAAGVPSVLASLWSVSDLGTLALMSEFYAHLGEQPMKADVLRQAQLSMLRGEAQLDSSQLYSHVSLDASALPFELDTVEEIDLSHPYYWSGFTMIGNPW